MKVILIDNYDSFTFNLYQYIEELGGRCQVVRNNHTTVDRIQKMKPDRIVISPGPGRPEGAGISMDLIKKLGQMTPILGVCLGHQAIGQVFGAHIRRAKKVVHGKISQIYHQGKGIFRGLKNPFSATRYHSLIVERLSLPEILIISSETEDGTVMGIQHKFLPIYGVQFHPESVMTTEGRLLIRNFLGASTC